MRRRVAALVALVAAAAAVALAVAVAVSEFPRGLVLLGCVVVAAASAWHGILRRGPARAAGLAIAALALAGALALLLTGGSLLAQVLVIAGILVALAAARAAISLHVVLPDATAPEHPVLFFNPRSGGGKAERFALADEARARGIEPIELKPGEDLEVLVRGAIDRGADGLAMAGGDGSQAIVAAMAAERGLPYACVPAGTRNHFALDLGVDRDDVVGALDAFVNGGERTVDLAEVNGRVFVNNVSLGLYAEAVQREGYRDAKLRTLLDTVPDVLGPGQRRPRPALDRAGRARPPLGRGGAGVQQPLSPGARRRLGHPAPDRRRAAGDHRVRRPLGPRRGRPPAPAAVARVVGPGLRGRRRSSRRRRHRRRGAETRSAAGVSYPAGSPAGADRPRAPRRLALGHDSRQRLGGRRRAGPHRRRPPAETPHNHTKETRMDLMEISEKQRMSREDAAARLHALADALARHNDVEFDRGGIHFKVHVPDEVEFKLEIEIEDDERELEIELKW